LGQTLQSTRTRGLSADELQAENQRLRQELLRIKTQRDILKKTLGILSTPNDSDLNA
jgi:hypothetical protein